MKPQERADNLYNPWVRSEDRAVFIRKTYLHVALALLAFIMVETILLNIPGIENLVVAMTGGYSWLIVIGLFYFATNYSQKLAFEGDLNKQYLGLMIYVIMEALIFVPILYIATFYIGTEIIGKAATIAGFLFAGLTAVVFTTGKDFSFLRSAIMIGGMVAMGLVVAGVIFGIDLGLWFSFGMVGLAGAAILYQTSQLFENYHPTQYVAAALGLFASFMTLFFYILNILMRSRD